MATSEIAAQPGEFDDVASKAAVRLLMSSTRLWFVEQILIELGEGFGLAKHVLRSFASYFASGLQDLSEGLNLPF